MKVLKFALVKMIFLYREPIINYYSVYYFLG